MPSFKTFAQGASALALGLAALTAPAQAGQTSDHVYSIQLSRDGISGTVVLKNTSANKHVNAVDIQPTKPNLSISLSGWVSCEKPPALAESRLSPNGTKMYFGTLGLGHGQVWEQNVLYEATYLPSHAGWDRANPITKAHKETTSVDQDPFVVPLAKVKNGPANLRFDPVAIFNQKLQDHLDGGGDKVAFLRQNHSFSVDRPISLGATCVYHYNNPNKNTIGGAWETVMVPLTIHYEGDPAINDTPVLNAQIGGNTPNGFQAGPSPFKITSMSFQPNMPHHVGACPATTKIRVNYMGQGKGEIRIRINDGGTTIHDSQKIAFDSKNGKQFYDFEIETPKASKFDLNKTVAHNLRVYVRGKDADEQIWPSHYEYKDAALWKHRCTPQVNPTLSGGVVGGVKQGGGASPSPTVKPKRAVPVDPTPSRPARAD
ncbi:hypothetical protein AAFN88_16225 [Pelagibius sp. CAU 1746]|uniref:hypothetical protein n=1 Tax=Pelagibius sp. CAU 1746 TaxID=3140370 RepID=UPI00325C1B8B